MFLTITPEQYIFFEQPIKEMFQLRYRVFCERLGWVKSPNGLERDNYDDLSPTYIVKLNSQRKVVAAARLLPTIGPNMLRDVFPELVEGQPVPQASDIWECSRFVVDTEKLKKERNYQVSLTAKELFAALVEFGLEQGLKHIVSVSEARIERIIQGSGWPVKRLGKPRKIGATLAVALSGEVSHYALRCIKTKSSLRLSVLNLPNRLELPRLHG